MDGQHPHDLFMELSVAYAHPLGEKTTVEIYFAPVGDPALGPVGFPHRISAAELPQAPLSHHLQDSTHIANEVLTVAFHKPNWGAELSRFSWCGTVERESAGTLTQADWISWSAAAELDSHWELERASFRRSFAQTRSAGTGRSTAINRFGHV